MASFVPTKGYVNCPKCNGWQVLDFTKRAVNGWPIGGFDYRDCDYCNGKGEIPSQEPGKWPVAPEPSWQVNPPKPKPRPKLEVVELEDNIPPPSGWPDTNYAGVKCQHKNTKIVWGKTQCADCTEWLT